MKSSSYVILIPILIALVAVVAVGASRFQFGSNLPAAPSPVVQTNEVPSLTGSVGEPKSGFSDMSSARPVSDLRKSFESTEFSDTSDLDGLSKDAASL